ncbi:MAG TPA: hypothetical protein VFT82_01080 [Candidatus Paceibacterota bacterium]|nr:hypothetical protein [Candidatus Paceibacterota bacterium]
MKNIRSFIYFIVPFCIITAIFLTIYAAMQQSIRLGANEPQTALAEDAAVALSKGAIPTSVVPPGLFDPSLSPSSFVAVYNDAGEVLESSGVLNGKIYPVPTGVFSSLASNDTRALTLEPEQGVRVASVIVRWNNPKTGKSGFVLAGRSLNIDENIVRKIGLMILLGYAASMIGWAIRLACAPREQRE